MVFSVVAQASHSHSFMQQARVSLFQPTPTNANQLRVYFIWVYLFLWTDNKRTCGHSYTCAAMWQSDGSHFMHFAWYRYTDRKKVSAMLAWSKNILVVETPSTNAKLMVLGVPRALHTAPLYFSRCRFEPKQQTNKKTRRPYFSFCSSCAKPSFIWMRPITSTRTKCVSRTKLIAVGTAQACSFAVHVTTNYWLQ